MFEGFRSERIAVDETALHARVGGQGEPVVLLHGYPQTHVCWHKVAPLLAARFTVVCPDLRGYGDSGHPPAGADSAGYSKRAMARDVVQAMERLGFHRFAVVGHDRGARVAYRMALDFPDRITKLAVLDIVPTLDTWERMDWHDGLGTYHWFFLAQPRDFPERLIGADPDYFLRYTLESWCRTPGAFTDEALAEYARCFRHPEVIAASCEDYRAGATIDPALDAADRAAGHKIACPVLALWGARRERNSRLDHLAIWRQWAGDVRGSGLPCGHFLPEESPDETAAALLEFLL